MVELHSDNSAHLVVLSPNKSMTWETNKKILLVMFFVSMIIGLAFTYVGAWMVLPFAGLEILLVGAGMYYVCWTLNFKQTISIQAESFVVQKGVYYPKHEWRWQTSQTRLIKQASNYRLGTPNLFLKNLNQTIEIGEFLNRADKKTLLESLLNLGIPMTVIPAK